jgi:hypothetical protein
VSRQDRGVGIEIDGALVLPGRSPETATDVDLANRTARRAQAFDRFDGLDQGRLEASQAVRQPARTGMEVNGIDRQVVPPGGLDGLIEPLEADPELGRSIARPGACRP